MFITDASSSSPIIRLTRTGANSRVAVTALLSNPQVFDLLVFLVQNHARVVSKEELIANVWDGRIVSGSTLTSRLNAARKAVGDSGKEQTLIRTLPRRGVRFVGDVSTDRREDPNERKPVDDFEGRNQRIVGSTWTWGACSASERSADSRRPAFRQPEWKT